MARPDWADRIAALRKDLGLLQTQFAELLGVTQAAVSQWEIGYKKPSGASYIRMGNLANEADCLWFWERGGVDMKRMERWISARKMPGKKSQKP
jgi:transcriptional regulator with XRE-family HTH domain